MFKWLLSASIGPILILSGFFLPSSGLIEFLRMTIKEPPGQLLAGAKLFKIGLVILGFLVIVLTNLSNFHKKMSKRKVITEPHHKLYLTILAALLLIASVLRLYGLGNGLWYDEILTYINYGRMPFGEILTTYDSENLHILFTLLANACLKIFGESNWSLRLPAVFFGIGSIWAIYLLGRQVGTMREALVAAALLTFSYHHIWFSQNARGYTGLLFWTILSSWLLMRALQEARPGLWLYYAASAALGAYTHITMVFVIMGHFIIYAVILFNHGREMWNEGRSGLFYGFFMVALLIFQLYAFVIPQIVSNFGEGSRSNVEAWKNPLWTLLELSRGIKIGFKGSILAIGALLVGGVGIWGFIRQNPVVIGLAFIPVFIGASISLAMGHPLWPRFFFFAMGFVVLIVVRGTTILGQLITKLLSLQSNKSVLIGTALCGGVIFVSALSIPSAYLPKQDYHGALVFVEHNKKPGDAIVTVGVNTTFPYRNFYRMSWEQAETMEDLNAIESRAERTWLLYTLPLHLQYEYPEMMKSIEKRYQIVREFYGTLSG
jgi:mannosyltransferase